MASAYAANTKQPQCGTIGFWLCLVLQ